MWPLVFLISWWHSITVLYIHYNMYYLLYVVNEEWLEGKLRGATGIFPKIYVENI